MKIFTKILERLPIPKFNRESSGPSEKLNSVPIVYRIGGGWSNHIAWEEFNVDTQNFRVWGHKPVRPREGDLLVARLGKGLGVFMFAGVRYESDPPDMFFGDVGFVGYTDEFGEGETDPGRRAIWASLRRSGNAKNS